MFQFLIGTIKTKNVVIWMEILRSFNSS